MQRAHATPRMDDDPGSLIADPTVRELHGKFRDAIHDMHDEVRIEATRFEWRALFRDALLCRVVPYRELFHVQVGKKVVWETRVRDASSCLAALHRALGEFLEVYASPGRGRSASPADAASDRPANSSTV